MEVRGVVVRGEHEKTGGELMDLAKEEGNRTLAIGVRTKYDNDKGGANVLEHAWWSGREK